MSIHRIKLRQGCEQTASVAGNPITVVENASAVYRETCRSPQPQGINPHARIWTQVYHRLDFYFPALLAKHHRGDSPQITAKNFHPVGPRDIGIEYFANLGGIAATRSVSAPDQ